MPENEKTHWSWQPAPYYILATVSFFAGANLYKRTRSEIFFLGGVALSALLASYAMRVSGESASKIVAWLGMTFAGMAFVHEFLSAPTWPMSENSGSGAVQAIVVDGITRYATTWEYLWLQSAFWIGLLCLAFLAITIVREWYQVE